MGYAKAITPEEAENWRTEQILAIRQQEATRQAWQDLADSVSRTADSFQQNQQAIAQRQQWRAPDVTQPIGGSNGITYNQVGTSLFGSNGVSYRRAGDTVFGTDGSTCQIVGSVIICR